MRVVGTAGHIDHGKSALVRALTGTDPDRLGEERRRGMTIDLGFAHLRRDPGPSLAFVDVPGHERFVRTMVAGASGVDVALLVIAADEGVMPQTREHVDVLTLLGVEAGVVAITKADLLPSLGADWEQLLEADIDDALAGTTLEHAPRLRVSAQTGEGLEALVDALARAAESAPPPRIDGPLVLPIDRAFALPGFGTVVTGTIFSGRLRVGDEVALPPTGPTGARVRGLQSHGVQRQEAAAGQRVAVNLAGAPLERLRRGLTLIRADEGAVASSDRLDVELSLLPSADQPLRGGQGLQLHLGTAQAQARVILPEAKTLAPGATTWAQLRLASPVVALPRQRFLLRGSATLHGRGRTVAGGTIVSTTPPRRLRGGAPRLEALLRGGETERLEQLLVDAGTRGATVTALWAASSLPRPKVEATLATLGARGAALCFDRETASWVSTQALDTLMTSARTLVERHHAAHPLAAGLPKEELRTRLGLRDPKLFALLTSRLGAAGLVVGPATIRSADHRPGAEEEDRALEAKILDRLRADDLSPPELRALATWTGEAEAKILAVLRLLEAKGAVRRVAHHLYYETEALERLRVRLVEHLMERGSISTQEFKELTGTSRKWLIPLGEFFDAERVTLRTAEATRILRGDRDTWARWLAGARGPDER